MSSLRLLFLLFVIGNYHCWKLMQLEVICLSSHSYNVCVSVYQSEDCVMSCVMCPM